MHKIMNSAGRLLAMVAVRFSLATVGLFVASGAAVADPGFIWTGSGGDTAPGIPPSGCYATEAEVTNYYIGSYPITVDTVTYSIIRFAQFPGGVGYAFRGTFSDGSFSESNSNAVWNSCDTSDTPDPDKDLPCPSDVPQQSGCSNPINSGTGNKHQKELDYAGVGAYPLRGSRIYNSGMGPSRVTGYGSQWRGFYDRSVTFISNPSGSTARLKREDATQYFFRPVGADWVPDGDVLGKLVRLVDGGGNAIGWTYTTPEDEVETYDADGKLISLKDRAGQTHTLTYSCGPDVSPSCPVPTPPNIAPKAGLLIAVTDNFGRQLNYSYDAVFRVRSMTDPAGGTYTFAYASSTNAASNLVRVTYPDTTFRTYIYGEPANTSGASLPNALTGITDENGVRYVTWRYDAQGRAISSEHGVGVGKVIFTYNADGTTSAVDSLSASRSYAFQISLGVVKNTGITGDPCRGCSASLSYDANGNIASRTDFNGNRTNYTYDLARNLETSRTEALTAAGGTTPQTRTISTEWHPNFRLVKRMAEPLRVTTYIYNGDGGASCGLKSDGVTLVPGVLCSKSIQATTDANGASGFGATASGAPRTWSYTYNQNGRVLSVDAPRTDVPDITAYTYYADDDANLGKRGNIATITNAAGHTTSITAYDAHGQPLTIADPNGLTTTLTYDARQRLTSRTVGGESTTYAYDNVGQRTKVTLPDTSFLSYSYDAAHRLTGIQDNLGNRIAYTLDPVGNRTKEEVFDPVNALAQTRSRVYSSLNRLFRELGAQNQTTEYAYDSKGNVTSVKDPLNHITTNQYDALNRLTQVTDPATGVTRYAYNGLDALTQVTDPRSLVTGYAVDGLGNLNQQVSPDTGTTTNTYDVAGNLLTQTDAKGQTTTYSYDALNRVSFITFHDGSKQGYLYDLGANGLGRLSTITETNPSAQVTNVIAYAYEQHRRVISETRTVNGVSYVLSYQYDSAGRMSGMTYPSGRTITYSFDALGRVNQVTTAKGDQTDIVVQGVTYQPFGGVKSFTLGNGQTYSRSYDQDGRIASYTLGASQFAIAYDAASRIEIISDVANPANSNTYGYDALDRLTSAILPSTPLAYSYDAVGNRVSKTVGSGTESYTYDTASNRLSTLTPTSGPTRTFGFDPNGSTVNDGLNSYAYDARGRMVQATSAVGATNYQVNALGQRIRKSNSSTDTVFHYDTRGKLIAESDPGGGFYKRELIYLGDIPVGVAQ